MKKASFLVLLSLSLASIFILPSGCGELKLTSSPGAPATSSATRQPGFPTPSPTAPSDIDRNVYNVDTSEEASQITGYAVGSPAFIPADFEPASRFMISTIGFGDAAFKQVTRVWKWNDDPSVRLQLTQSPRHFKIGGGQPAEVNGKPGQRALLHETEAPPELTLAWEQDSAFFALTGTINGPLNEQVLLEIAASIELQ